MRTVREQERRSAHRPLLKFGEATVTAAEKQQWICIAKDIEVQNFTEHEPVIAGIACRVDIAFDNRYRAINDRQIIAGNGVIEISELIFSSRSEFAAYILLIASQNVHAKMSRGLNQLPSRRPAIRKKAHQKRIERDRSKGAHDHSDRFASWRERRDRADSGRIMPQGMPERRTVNYWPIQITVSAIFKCDVWPAINHEQGSEPVASPIGRAGCLRAKQPVAEAVHPTIFAEAPVERPIRRPVFFDIPARQFLIRRLAPPAPLRAPPGQLWLHCAAFRWRLGRT